VADCVLRQFVRTGKLRVPMLRNQPRDVVSSATPTRLTHDRQRPLTDVRQGETRTITRRIERHAAIVTSPSHPSERVSSRVKTHARSLMCCESVTSRKKYSDPQLVVEAPQRNLIRTISRRNVIALLRSGIGCYESNPRRNDESGGGPRRSRP
jgi:hypothetical protein